MYEMISLNDLIVNITHIPSEWIFEYYLKLTEKLFGQHLKMNSVFNSEKTPSMHVYVDRNTSKYKFKDFSSGYGGDGISLVQYLFGLPDRYEASYMINKDFEIYSSKQEVTVAEFINHDRYKVTDYTIRHWNNLDQAYWMSYQIDSKMLNKYNVFPLEYYTMTKENLDGSESFFTVTKNYLYGYFKEDGTLYKVYQPKNLKKKFIKVHDYTQGIEQLNYDKKYLIITSSLKDLMDFNILNIGNIESIAPDSENSMINENLINDLKSKYKKIIVLFDNDDPGLKAAQRYKDRYGIDFITLSMEKDLSDSIKIHGVQKTKEMLFLLLKQAL
jgi:hypothetical protein